MQNNSAGSALVYFIAFAMLLSFGGTIVGALVGVFGFPYQLTCLGFAALLAGGGYLYQRGYSTRTFVLMAAIFVIVSAALALYRGMTATEPTPPAGIPAGLLDQYYRDLPMFGGYFDFGDDMVASLGEDPVLIDSGNYFGMSFNTGYTYLFELDTIVSLDAQWELVDDTVQVIGLNRPTIISTTVDPASVQFLTRPNATLRESTVFIELNPRLPVQSNSAHRFTVTVVADVVYPDVNGNIQRQTLSRNVEVIVLPNEFYTYELEYAEYRRVVSVTEDSPGIPALVAMIAFSTVLSGYLIRTGALKRPAGSFARTLSTGGPVVRALSGMQKFGLEVHPLLRVPLEARQGQTKGLFVGIVNPQSPAGRADIRSGDIITSFNGKTVTSARMLQLGAAKMGRNQLAEAVIIRDGEELWIVVKF